MNVHSRLARHAAPFWARELKLIVFAGWLACCSNSKPPPTISVPPASFNELKRKIASIRELPFKREIALASESSRAPTASAEGFLADEYGPQSLAQLSHAYKRLGLLPEATDFDAVLADYVRLERTVFYEARKDLLVVSPDATSPSVEQLPVLFGLSRALQEQHFHWQTRLNGIALEDRKLAFRALAAGDALLVGVAYMQESQQLSKPSAPAAILARWAKVLEQRGSHLPQLLQQKLLFPYREGRSFVQWAYAAKDWTGVNALFADPPLSTAQILHAEKYYVKRENPLHIRPAGLAQQVKASAVVDQTLGEYLVESLLASELSRREARQIAAGWSGDQLSAYPEGKNLLTAWITAWKTDANARAFYRAYQTLLERRHRLRFAASTSETDRLQAGLPGDQSMLLQIQGPFVLLLDGAPTDRALQLADEIWKNLDAETESTVIPFDLAKGRTQLALKSK